MRININNEQKAKNEQQEAFQTFSAKPASSKASLSFVIKKYRYFFVAVILLLDVFLMSFVLMDFLSHKEFIPIDASFVELRREASDFKISRVENYEVREKENPVNGMLVTKDNYEEMLSRKLVVISINNHSKARPQFGLSDADLILEVLAEGGITRYNAFYYQNQDVKKIGPIRSARSYMLQFFLGFDDPVFVHEGQASYPPQETPVEETNTLKHLWQWDIESMQTAGSRYRDPERIKSAGYVHSLMTGFDLINAEIDRLNWKASSNITPISFKFDAPEEERGSTGTIKINFTSLSTNYYSAQFDYDIETNSYLRSVGGQEDYDANSMTRIAPKNVVVEYHNYRDANDGHSRIIIDMIGEDTVFVFRDGQMIKGKWVKNSKEDRTKYYDESGKEIELNRGQIWVVNAIKTSTKNVTEVYVGGELIN